MQGLDPIRKLFSMASHSQARQAEASQAGEATSAVTGQGGDTLPISTVPTQSLSAGSDPVTLSQPTLSGPTGWTLH